MTGPLAPARVAKIRDSFARQTLMATLDASLAEIGPGVCVIAAPIGPGSLQQHGYAHAGLTFSLADSAAGYAALSLMPEDAEVLSVELKINMLSPAKGDRLVATGRVVKAGRRVVVVQAEVWAEDGDEPPRQVALMQGTMIPA